MSGFYGQSKNSIFKRLRKNKEEGDEFLEVLGKVDSLTELGYDASEKFLLKIIYNDQKNSKLNVARASKWKSMKNKSTSRLPPDKDSYRQHVYRAHHQAKIWYNFRDSGDQPNPVGCGYILSGQNLLPSPHTKDPILNEMMEMMHAVQLIKDESSDSEDVESDSHPSDDETNFID